MSPQTVVIKPGPTEQIYPVYKIAVIVECLAEEGIGAADALAGAHLTLAQLHSPDTRVSLSQVIRCCRNANRLSADPHFAWRAGLRMHVSSYGMYGFGILSSVDFRQAARFAEQYHELATPIADIRLREEEDCFVWTVDPYALSPVDASLYRFVVELYFGSIVAISSDVMGRSFTPRLLRVIYDDENASAQTFGCPVLFNQVENGVVADRKWIEGPAELGNALAHAELKKLCDRLMAELKLKIGVAGAVREALLINLAQPLSFAMLSRRLKVAPRTLKRRLMAEGTSYRKIVDEMRTQVAIKYLRDTTMTAEEIASCLGFSDGASFRHAFVRWTKQTPAKFRQSAHAAVRTGIRKAEGRATDAARRPYVTQS